MFLSLSMTIMFPLISLLWTLSVSPLVQLFWDVLFFAQLVLCMKGVFKCAMEDDERTFRRLKRLSLGMPPSIPFFINNYQFVSRCTIFLSLHALCAILGASCS